MLTDREVIFYGEAKPSLEKKVKVLETRHSASFAQLNSKSSQPRTASMSGFSQEGGTGVCTRKHDEQGADPFSGE